MLFYSVEIPPINATVDASYACICVLDQSSTGCTGMSTLNISWPSSINVDQYIVTIDDKQYKVSQNSIIVSRPGGTYSVTIEAINSCGKKYFYVTKFPARVDPNIPNCIKTSLLYCKK